MVKFMVAILGLVGLGCSHWAQETKHDYDVQVSR